MNKNINNKKRTEGRNRQIQIQNYKMQEGEVGIF